MFVTYRSRCRSFVKKWKYCVEGRVGSTTEHNVDSYVQKYERLNHRESAVADHAERLRRTYDKGDESISEIKDIKKSDDTVTH